MTHDPADRLVEPGATPGAELGGAEVPEADVLEQVLSVDGGAESDIYAEPLPLEANPDDVAEQRLEVPFDDDDYPVG